MYDRVLWTVGLLFVIGGAPVAGQTLTVDGTVTELSGDRIVVERDTSVSVSDGTQGQLFTTTRLGQGGEQKIVAAAMTVNVVTGTLVVGQITARSDLVDVSVGQKVSFGSTGPAASPGTIAVQSSPTRAEVEIVALGKPGGSARRLGTTPLRESVSPGRYRVRLSKAKHRPAEKTVHVRSGATRNVESDLEPKSGTLVIRPTPDSAAVAVDGNRVGRGTVEEAVEVGEHEVTIEAAGYRDTTRRVTVEAEATRSFAPSLDRKMGTLQVSTVPSGATVRLDGSELGTAPVSTKTPVGTHRVIVSESAYAPDTSQVTVQASRPREMKVELQRPVDVQLARAKGPVRGVKMNRDGKQLVLQYGLRGSEEAYDVELQLSRDRGESYDDIETAITGDVGEEIKPGSDKEIRWTVLQEFQTGIYGEKYRLRLEAEAASQPGGFTIQVLSKSNNVPSFGGATIGWTGEGGYATLSYTKLTHIEGLGTEEISSIGLRGGPVWRLGWFSLKPIFGFAIREGDLVGQGGSGVYFGRSLYVGTEFVYSTDFSDGAELGTFFAIGVAL